MNFGHLWSLIRLIRLYRSSFHYDVPLQDHHKFLIFTSIQQTNKQSDNYHMSEGTPWSLDVLVLIRKVQFRELLSKPTNLTCLLPLHLPSSSLSLTDCPRNTRQAIINLMGPARRPSGATETFQFVTNLVPPLRCHRLTTIQKVPARAGDTQSPNFAQDLTDGGVFGRNMKTAFHCNILPLFGFVCVDYLLAMPERKLFVSLNNFWTFDATLVCAIKSSFRTGSLVVSQRLSQTSQLINMKLNVRATNMNELSPTILAKNAHSTSNIKQADQKLKDAVARQSFAANKFGLINHSKC